MPKNAIISVVNETINNSTSPIYADVYYGTSLQDFWHNLIQGIIPVLWILLIILVVAIFCFGLFKLTELICVKIRGKIEKKKNELSLKSENK